MPFKNARYSRLLTMGFAVPAVVLIVAALGVGPASAVTPLVPYTVVNGGIPKPLTSTPGNPAAGMAIVENRKLGNCLACHSLPIKGAADPGNVGPNLAHVVSYTSPAVLRLRVVDPKQIDPQTIMPAYYRLAGLTDVEKKFAGKPILTAQQIEDVVAYLASLK